MWGDGTTFGTGSDNLGPKSNIDVEDKLTETLDFPEAALKAAGTAAVPKEITKAMETPVQTITAPEPIVFSQKEQIKIVEDTIDKEGKIIDINPAIEKVNKLINENERIIQELIDKQAEIQNKTAELRQEESDIVIELTKNTNVLEGLKSTLQTLEAIKNVVESKPSLN